MCRLWFKKEEVMWKKDTMKVCSWDKKKSLRVSTLKCESLPTLKIKWFAIRR